jgi:parallel beta-helix repeat protein
MKLRNWFRASIRNFAIAPAHATSRRQPRRLHLDVLEDRTAPATFSVTSVADSGVGSFRQAILDANNAIGADVIEFNIGGGGAQSIAPASELPYITDAVTIDGWSQPGFAGVPLIELSGGGGWGSGLTITGSNVTVRGLVINNFRSAGIGIEGGGGNVIQGNYIGANAAGTADLGNFGTGVYIQYSSNNTIGGATPETRNVISGNGVNGIVVAIGSGNVIQGNYIGTNAAGDAVIGNTGYGIWTYDTECTRIVNNVVSGSLDGMTMGLLRGATIQGNLIGTNAAGTMALGNSANGISLDGSDNTIAGNTIAGNGERGILFRDSAEHNVVEGNFIGTNAAGAAGLGNALDGILISFSPNNTIGGTTAGAGNVISGNGGNGISIVDTFGGTLSSGTFIQGNYIGTNVAGTAALGNAANGIKVDGSSNTTIGGTTAAARNVISGNAANGIFIDNGGPASGNIIQGNYIGTDASGTTAIGNGTGIYVYGTVGTVIDGNIASGNLGAGMSLDLPSGSVIKGNRVGTNAAGTSALGNLGHGISFGGVNSAIGGTALGEGNIIAGNGGNGLQLIGPAHHNDVEGNIIGTNAAGDAGLGNGAHGIYILFAPNNTIGGTTAGAGNVISGNGGNGISIVDTFGGTLSPGTKIQGNYIGTSPDGTADLGNAANGIKVDGSASTTIGGTTAAARNVISGNDANGIFIDNGGPASGNVIRGNYIGTDASGTAAIGNGTGIYVYGTVGTVIDGNLASGNLGAGMSLDLLSGAVIQGNRVGTNAAGTSALGNLGHGISFGGVNSAIGGTALGEGNIIASNGGNGLQLIGPAHHNEVEGNIIGTNAAGDSGLGNGAAGVLLNVGVANNTIGGTASGEANVIAYNILDGVIAHPEAGTGNPIRGNSIYANGRLGINLVVDREKAPGATANDLGDADTGPNNLQNFPVIASSEPGATTHVVGSINSTPNTTLKLDFYANTSDDPSGHGEGERYLGAITVTTDGDGNASFDAILTAATTTGEFITATATDPDGNTSEFSAHVVNAPNPVVDTTTTVTAANAIYDGNPHEATAVVAPGSPAGTVTFLYTGTGATVYSSSTAPTNAGTYHVVATFTPANPAAYNPSSGSADFTISKATLTGDAATQDALNMAKQGKLTITVSNVSGLLNGDTLITFLSTAEYSITVGANKYVFVPTTVTISGTGITVAYTLKNSALASQLAAELADNTSAATAVSAGFFMESLNYMLTDEYLTRLFSTAH